MDTRLIEFVRALRAAGVRVSLAESQDAGDALDAVGVAERERFRAALRATLVKEARDHATFDYLFPALFRQRPTAAGRHPSRTDGGAARYPAGGAGCTGGADAEALAALLRQLLEGQHFSESQLQQLGEQSGLAEGESLMQRRWFERRMRRAAGLRELEELIRELMQALAELGMSAAARAQLLQLLEANSDALGEQLGAARGQQSGAADGRARAGTAGASCWTCPSHSCATAKSRPCAKSCSGWRRDCARGPRCVSNGRGRASRIPRRTLRASLRYGGLPLEIKRRSRAQKAGAGAAL